MDELAFAYGRILKTVWSLPMLSHQFGEYSALTSDVQTSLVKRLGWPGMLIWWLRLPFYPIKNWWRSFVFRPIVSFYVTTHVYSSSSKLHAALVKERLERGNTSGPDIELLDQSIAGLERLRTSTTGWGALLVILKFVPLIGLVFSMGLVSVSFTLRDAPNLILRMITFVPITVLFLHPLAIQFGFRWKRSLFADGIGEIGNGLSADSPPGTSARSIYESEQRTYHRMGLTRMRELPVDLLLAPGFYFLLYLMVGFASGSIAYNTDATESSDAIGNAALITIFGTFFLMSAARLVIRYKLRRISGDY